MPCFLRDQMSQAFKYWFLFPWRADFSHSFDPMMGHRFLAIEEMFSNCWTFCPHSFSQNGEPLPHSCLHSVCIVHFCIWVDFLRFKLKQYSVLLINGWYFKPNCFHNEMRTQQLMLILIECSCRLSVCIDKNELLPLTLTTPSFTIEPVVKSDWYHKSTVSNTTKSY